MAPARLSAPGPFHAFDSPLSLWIEIWPRQLVYPDAPRVATLAGTVAEAPGETARAAEAEPCRRTFP